MWYCIYLILVGKIHYHSIILFFPWWWHYHALSIPGKRSLIDWLTFWSHFFSSSHRLLQDSVGSAKTDGDAEGQELSDREDECQVELGPWRSECRDGRCGRQMIVDLTWWSGWKITAKIGWCLWFWSFGTHSCIVANGFIQSNQPKKLLAWSRLEVWSSVSWCWATAA